MRKILLCLLLAASPAFAQTAAEWRADLAHMSAEMKARHKNLFHTVDEHTFDAKVSALDARIPTLERHEIIVELMRIAAMVGDGHTNVSAYRDPKIGFHSLPIRLYAFDDGLYITFAEPAQRGLVGRRVTAIGDVPIAEARERVGAIIARDNAMGAEVFVPVYLAMPEILHALGLSDSPQHAVFTLVDAKGRASKAKLDQRPPADAWPPDIDVSLEMPAGLVGATTKPPTWLADPRTFHRLVPLPERKALYAQLNKVTDAPEQTMAAFGEAIRDRAAADDLRTIILDLRLNRGGNGALVPAFVRSMAQANDGDTALYVLIGRSSFSATQFLADDLDRYTSAILVGEPTGSKSSAYGDSFKIVLPASGITARASIYWWQESQRHDDPWTEPQVAAPLEYADYAAGRDPALEAALAGAKPDLLVDTVLPAAKAGGVDAVREALSRYEARPANRWLDMERGLLHASIALFRGGHVDEAGALTAIAADRFPASADVQFIRAQVAMKAGDAALAKRSVQRAIAIDRNHRDAIALRSQLESSP